MKMWEINQLSKEDLEQKLLDLVEEHQNLRFQHATKQLENPLRLAVVKKDIARIKTVLKEIELGIRGKTATEV